MKKGLTNETLFDMFRQKSVAFKIKKKQVAVDLPLRKPENFKLKQGLD